MNLLAMQASFAEIYTFVVGLSGPFTGVSVKQQLFLEVYDFVLRYRT